MTAQDNLRPVESLMYDTNLLLLRVLDLSKVATGLEWTKDALGSDPACINTNSGL